MPQMGRRDELRALQTYGWVVGRSSRPVVTCKVGKELLLATGNFAGGISPYFQLRLHIFGDRNGRGFQLGSSATYKFVGFGSSQGVEGQDPGEMEFAVSAQYRQRVYELGLQGVIGKDFATTEP